MARPGICVLVLKMSIAGVFFLSPVLFDQVYWEKPRYTKIYDLMLPTGQKIKVKSGTQIIERFWRHLRSHLQYTARAPGNPIMTRKTRAAQWVLLAPRRKSMEQHGSHTSSSRKSVSRVL